MENGKASGLDLNTNQTTSTANNVSSDEWNGFEVSPTEPQKPNKKIVVRRKRITRKRCLRVRQRGNKITTINTTDTHRRWNTKKIFCAYCKRIGGNRLLYEDHDLKDDNGKIMCPVLREDGCPFCDITGDEVHLPEDCPKGEQASP